MLIDEVGEGKKSQENKTGILFVLGGRNKSQENKTENPVCIDKNGVACGAASPQFLDLEPRILLICTGRYNFHSHMLLCNTV